MDCDTREWREIIETILNDMEIFDGDAKKILQRMNGVIGAANSSNKESSPEELYYVLLQKFSSHAYLRPIVKHPDFEKFAIKKVLSLRLR